MSRDDVLEQQKLHNAQVELEALRAEGRRMVWENESAAQQKLPPPHVNSFDDLASRIRSTKVQIQDAVALRSIR